MAELTVIGGRAGSPGSCGPASGYVLTLAEKTLLIDCGPGVVAGLAGRELISKLDAVVVTHQHADHCADLIALAYHRAFPERLRPLPLFGPPSLVRVLAQMDATFGIPTLDELREPIAAMLPFTELFPGDQNGILGVDLSTYAMRHPVETFALRFPQVGFTFTSDGSLTEGLERFAFGSDVLLAEATYLHAGGRDLEAHGHMTAEDAGRLAARANVARLVTTHYADCSERDAIRDSAQGVFGRSTEAAAPGTRVRLG